MSEHIENDAKERLAEEIIKESAEEEQSPELAELNDEKYDAKMKTINRTLLVIVGVILIVVVGVLGFGLWKDLVQTPRMAIATVGDEEITVSMYQTRARYFRFQLLQEVVRIEEVLITRGDFDGLQQSTYDYIVAMVENPSQIGASTMNSLVEDIILQHKAEEFGIVITEEDIDAAFFEKLAETTADPAAYTQEQFEIDYAEFMEKKAAADLKEKDVREMRRNILIRDAVMVALSEDVITDEATQKTIFNEWLQEERLAIAETMEIDQELMEASTPEEPVLSDPKVFEALYGMTMAEYSATQDPYVEE